MASTGVLADDESLSSSPSCNRGRQRTIRIDVILLDGTQCQVCLDYRANGQDCLDKVCQCLGVFHEVDYFGLTYFGAKREELWVNMRNRLYQQLPTTLALNGVYRLYLRVKFYVPPHMMLHQETRHQVYLDVRSRLLDRHHWLLDKELQQGQGSRSPDSGSDASSSFDLEDNSHEEPLAARLAALIVQADFGSGSLSSSNRLCRQILSRLLDFNDEDSCYNDNDSSGGSGGSCGTDSFREEFLELCKSAMEYHNKLLELSPTAAEYRLLQTASAGLSMYGSHYHEAKDHLESRLNVAVGPDAVWLCRPDAKTAFERHPYPRVQQVTISDRFLYLSLSQENGSIREMGFRLASPKAANCLYRCVTETHSFFRCDTVRNNVATKTCRDVKGAFVSLFVERELSSVRNFVFDVRRTAKEVHDNARRQLHKCLSAASAAPGISGAEAKKVEDVDRISEKGNDETRASLLERIRRLEQSRLCQICSDASVSIVFLPCGHMMACGGCANRLETCPICRAEICTRQACFTRLRRYVSKRIQTIKKAC
uniref:RING-type E3 ubiquitin transferase n=1 Tax=Macrostomum lignano TaxID=282301 RepID=A0A1I8HFD5_9PLAT